MWIGRRRKQLRKKWWGLIVGWGKPINEWFRSCNERKCIMHILDILLGKPDFDLNPFNNLYCLKWVKLLNETRSPTTIAWANRLCRDPIFLQQLLISNSCDSKTISMLTLTLCFNLIKIRIPTSALFSNSQKQVDINIYTKIQVKATLT